MAVLQRVSAPDFKSKLQSGEFRILDVRNQLEFESGHLPNAELVNIQSPDFFEKLQALPKDTKYLVYCRSGGRSALALQFMEKLGFTEVYELDGGILNFL